MRRREFLKAAVATGVWAAFSRGVPAGGWPATPLPALASAEPSGLEEITILELQASMKAGRASARSLVKHYLARIEAIDRHGPALRSVIETNPEAPALARELDRERRASRLRGPLHGVPVLIKDNIDTHDRMTTTAGSLALAGSIPPRDAFLVEKLRRAGAVILGKTNLSEWANFRSSQSTSGWSGGGGLTRNPYALDRNPSGSSAGSAVAVAANLCAAGIGTETDGSILSPASYNGIVGLKSTVGLISRSGIIPISETQDTAGPMTRTVADAAMLLGCLAGQDDADLATQGCLGKTYSDYTVFLDAGSLRGARIGVARKFFGTSSEADQLLERALATMKSLGAILIDPADLPSHGKAGGAEFEVMLYEFKAGLNAYLARLGPDAPVHSLAEIIEFNESHRAREMPHFNQDIFLKAEAKGPLTEKAYLEARETCRRLMRTEGIDAVMNQHQLDAIVAPTAGPAHVTDLLYGDRDTGGSTSPAAIAGYPSITVPAGLVRGLPVGLSFFGRAWSEPRLLALAYAFEQATHARKPPTFVPTLAG